MTKMNLGLPTLWEIAWYWNGLGEHDPFCIDLSRPECAGCYLAPRRGQDQRHFKNRWNFSGLHRGHLVNRCFGGPDTVENLVPLCWLCNHRMPFFDPGERQGAIGWVLNGGWAQHAEWTGEGLVMHLNPGADYLVVRFAD